MARMDADKYGKAGPAGQQMRPKLLTGLHGLPLPMNIRENPRKLRKNSETRSADGAD
jgi:hypothetical protein